MHLLKENKLCDTTTIANDDHYCTNETEYECTYQWRDGKENDGKNGRERERKRKKPARKRKKNTASKSTQIEKKKSQRCRTKKKISISDVTRNQITSFWIKRIMLKNKVIKRSHRLESLVHSAHDQIHIQMPSVRLPLSPKSTALVRSFIIFSSVYIRTTKKPKIHNRTYQYYYTFNCLSFHIFGVTF